MVSIRRIAASTAIGAALLTGVSMATMPIASAVAHVSTTPKPMKISASGGDGTTVDHDGTEGSFAPAVQGKIDDDGDQDAFMITSGEASPQEKAEPAKNRS